ncbi:MAG: hypothetical protein AB7G87_10600, partial [Clostridia bacterium]
MKNRIVAFLLIFSFMLGIFPSIPVIAFEDDGDLSSNNVRLLPNKILISSNAVAGTSGIRYRTIGYKASIIIDKKYSYILDYNQLNDNNLREYTIPFTKDESTDKSIRNLLIEKYPSDAAKINEYWEQGGRIYMDAIMVITVNGEPQGSISVQSYIGKVYDTPEGIINAQYQYNGKWYPVPWAAVTVKELPSHFGWIDFKSQIEYMEVKHPAIDVDFDLLPKVMEYQGTGFKDNTTAENTVIKNWRATVNKVGGGSGIVYPNKELAEKDLAKGLPEGEYTITVYADNGENGDNFCSDQDTKTIVVIKPDPLIAIAIEKAKDEQGNKIDTAEIGQTFIITGEDSFASKGAKIVKWQHYLSKGETGSFELASEEKEFESSCNEETVLYYYLIIEDTAGITATSSVIALKITDNSPSLADAEIYSPDTYYEGLYESVGNWSTFEYKGDTYSASEAQKKGIGNSSWKFQDLDIVTKGSRLQTAKYETNDWKSAEGGKLRFFTIGNKQLYLKARGRGSEDTDTKAVQVIQLPKAKGLIEGYKKNREVYIYNQSLFKPIDSWQDEENGYIDDSKTKITIINMETGQVATSIGGSPFNASFVKGVTTEFGEIDQGDYTHKKYDMTKVIFVGDDASDQKTERFKIQIQVTDNRGKVDTWEEIRVIEGDKKPVALLKGIFNYIRSPIDKKANTDIEVHSYSSDFDTTEDKVKNNFTVLPIVGARKKVGFNPDKTGDYTLSVNIIERFISNIIAGLRAFLSLGDEKQDNKNYTVKVDNIAPTVSFNAIKPTHINMLSFIDDVDTTKFDNEMNSFINDMSNENISVNNIQNLFIDEEGWFKVTNQAAIPNDMINEVKTALAAGKAADIVFDKVSNKYFRVATTIETSRSHRNNGKYDFRYNEKQRIYDIESKSLLKEMLIPRYSYGTIDQLRYHFTPAEWFGMTQPYKNGTQYIIFEYPRLNPDRMEFYYYEEGIKNTVIITADIGDRVSYMTNKDFFVGQDGNTYILAETEFANLSMNVKKYFRINTSIPLSQYSTSLQATEITYTQYQQEKTKNNNFLTTLDKIKLLDSEAVSSATLYEPKTHISYEDENIAYYQIYQMINAAYSAFAATVKIKEYNKKTNTIRELFSKDIGSYVPKSIPYYEILQTSYITVTSAVIKGQYVVTITAEYEESGSGDDEGILLKLLHFNSSGTLVKNMDMVTTYDMIRGNGTGIKTYSPNNPVAGIIHGTEYTNEFYGGYYNVDTKQGALTRYYLRDLEGFSNKYIFAPYFASNSGYREAYVYNTVTGSEILKLNNGYFVTYPDHVKNKAEYIDNVLYSQNSELYNLYVPTNTKTLLTNIPDLTVGDYLTNKIFTVKDSSLYVYYLDGTTPIIRKADIFTGDSSVSNAQVYNPGAFPTHPTKSSRSYVSVYTNPYNEVKEYWTEEGIKNTGYIKIRYSEKITDSLKKLNNYPSSSSVDNIFTIATSKKLDLTNLGVTKILQKIEEINTDRGYTGDKIIKVIFLDIGGNNATYAQQLTTATGGAYYNCTNNTDALARLGDYIKTKATPIQATGTVNIKVGDIIQLNGQANDYEGDPITIEQYRSQGKTWKTFATGIQNLGNNKLKFTQQGTFILEFRAKDAPPTVNIDTSKYSNTAQLTVIVGDGSIVEPPTPLPPDIALTIKGSKADGSCVERHRVDFIVTGFQGTNLINWSTLNIQFNQTDYLPYMKPKQAQFSRIFKNTGLHSVTITIKDTTGLTTTKTFPFTVYADLPPIAGFSISGNGRRNMEGYAEFDLTENVSSSDDTIGSIEYFSPGTKYIIDDSGNVVSNGTVDYPVFMVGSKLTLQEVGTKQIKQVVKEYYENGIGLDGVDLNLDGYRIFKTAQTVRNPEVINVAPTLTYSVSPNIILKGSSVAHEVSLMDDTTLGDTIKYKFIHEANLQNNDGVDPQNNILTDAPTSTLVKKGLYTFYAQATDEDGESTGLVNGGQVKVVSEPVADFELVAEPLKNDGENRELHDDIFNAGSTITIQNLSRNDDYGLTLNNHGIKYTKIEYKKVGEDKYTTLFEADNLTFYLFEYHLPTINERAIYEVKLTVRSVDGFENVKTKYFTLLELRMDASLTPDTVYASQKYKIKAVL